jgi:hypothetical protein
MADAVLLGVAIGAVAAVVYHLGAAAIRRR